MKNTEEKAMIVDRSQSHLDSLNSELEKGWKVKLLCPYSQSSPYAEILVILEREIDS